MATAHVSGKHKYKEIILLIRSYHGIVATLVNIHFSDSINTIGLQIHA